MSLRRSARVNALKVAQEVITSSNLGQDALPNGIAESAKGKNHRTISSVTRKAIEAAEEPSTPPRKRKRTGLLQSQSPLPTATPAAVRLMTVPYSSGDVDAMTPPPADRPAEPHRTNAPLISPETSRVVAYSDEVSRSSPSKSGMPYPTTTTGNLLEEACVHLLQVDPGLKRLIDKHPCRLFSPEGLAEEIDPFRSLTSGIIAQQVSGAAAKSIKNKFVALFNDPATEETDKPQTFPTPSQVASSDLAHLRTAGLSGRKAEYIKGLAEKFVDGELSADMLVKASDEEVLERLTAVRGLGRWSVEMFACFGLKRMDVFSTGDLGVQRGMAVYLGKDVSKLKAKGGKWKYLSEKEMLDTSARFAPYRSLFMWYMWRIEDVDVDAMQIK
ncbi:MAG: 3-methyladenine DNA glycosylase [Peltula sp. TS41687]|nr:MAG: 3-methyladenine DNA glycosylase [Peltula sp. TS41687]